jgi:hypothetical protein
MKWVTLSTDTIPVSVVLVVVRIFGGIHAQTDGNLTHMQMDGSVRMSFRLKASITIQMTISIFLVRDGKIT